MEKIVDCNLSDLQALSDISVQTFSETFAKDNTEKNMSEFLHDSYNNQTLKDELEDDNSRFYFLLHDDKKVGYLKIRLKADLVDFENILEIERIYLLKEYQNHGWGKLLMNYAQDMAVKLKKDGICLGVWENNFKAQRFYDRQGFVKIGSHDFNLGDSRQTDFTLLKKFDH
ncbi:GNAT family N-acetyltransferase [Companilactobacillus baiquanensis]|uniref:GNAT family N-acetyltransferase n=1 Tax=Companilactobacillus baiquanensis TaxID=2486005 RepID=A0ABW1UT37_9LACO|nr:GNAT family N-acetyltransferase [Companilactobacillus baiquanensis]